MSFVAGLWMQSMTGRDPVAYESLRVYGVAASMEEDALHNPGRSISLGCEAISSPLAAREHTLEQLESPKTQLNR